MILITLLSCYACLLKTGLSIYVNEPSKETRATETEALSEQFLNRLL